MFNLDHEKQIMKRLYAPFVASDHDYQAFHKFWYLKEEAINTRLTEVLGVTGWSKVVTHREIIPQGEPVIEMGGSGRKDRILLNNYPGQWEAYAGKYYQIVDNVVEDEPASKGVPAKTHIEGTKRGDEIPVIFDIPCVLYHGYLEVCINGRVAQKHGTGGDVLTDLGRENGSRYLNTYKGADTDLLKRLARAVGVGLYLTEIKKAEEPITNEAGMTKWLAQAYRVFDNVNAAKRFLMAETKLDKDTIAKRLEGKDFEDSDFLHDYNTVLEAVLAAA